MLQLGQSVYFHVQRKRQFLIFPGVVRGLWLNNQRRVVVHILTDIGFYTRRENRVFETFDAAKREQR